MKTYRELQEATIITDPVQLEKEWGDLIAMTKDEKKDNYYRLAFKELDISKRKALVKQVSGIVNTLMKL